MRRFPLFARIAAAAMALAVLPSPTSAQKSVYPPISARQFASGSARMTVKGSIQIDQDVPINTTASYGDGETTWLQFGVSGAETPNVLVTYGDTGEIGIIVGKAKFIATAGVAPGEEPQCAGKSDVSATSVSGQYSCRGIVSHDGATGKMGNVDIEIRFTAKS